MRDRGYATVALTPERVTADWHFVSSVRSHDLALASSHRMTATRGRNAYDKG